MKISRIEGNLYEIQDGTKWWTAIATDGKVSNIMSAKMRPISEKSAIGRKIVKAIKDRFGWHAK